MKANRQDATDDWSRLGRSSFGCREGNGCSVVVFQTREHFTQPEVSTSSAARITGSIFGSTSRVSTVASAPAQKSFFRAAPAIFIDEAALMSVPRTDSALDIHGNVARAGFLLAPLARLSCSQASLGLDFEQLVDRAFE